MGVLFVCFFCFFVFRIFGFSAPGEKKARQEATARKDRKEGGRQKSKEGRKEGTVFLFRSAVETLAATVLFANP